MQRHKSVEKRERTSKAANIVNKMGRSKIKTAIKKVLSSNDKANANEALNSAVSVLDKSVKSGLIHRNNAANKKSILYKFVNTLEK